MIIIAYITAIALGTMAMTQAVLTFMFVCFLRRKENRSPAETAWPKVAILLPLRGADIKLREVIECLLRLDYPDFQLHIIVDSPDDPAWEVVQDATKQTDEEKVLLSFLENRRTTCSSQCSAFVQAISSLDPSVEIVVTIDGDVVVHSDWLKSLVAPFQDKTVGATFGNRWFMPKNNLLGSIVRYLWNSVALVAMWLHSIPWGGTMAIRKSIFDEIGILDHWKRTMVHDASAASLLHRHRKKVQFVPSLIMPIREDCSLAFCLDFLKRQMMWTRIYHPNWWAIFIHAVVTTSVFVLAGFAAAIAIATGNSMTTTWLVGALLGYLLISLICLATLEANIAKIIKQRGDCTKWLTISGMLKIPFAVPLTQCIHMIAVLLAGFRNKVTWRNITYLIRDPYDIEITKEGELGVAADAENSNYSL